MQYEVIYDLAWIYRNEDALHGKHMGLAQEVCDRFHCLVGQCLRMLDPMNIEGYPDVKRSTAQREAMVHGYAHEPWRWQSLVIDGVDEDKGLVKLVYHFTGELPVEEVFVGGVLTPLAMLRLATLSICADLSFTNAFFGSRCGVRCG